MPFEKIRFQSLLESSNILTLFLNARHPYSQQLLVQKGLILSLKAKTTLLYLSASITWENMNWMRMVLLIQNCICILHEHDNEVKVLFHVCLEKVLLPYATGNTLFCGWVFVTAGYITMYIVSRKHSFRDF